MLSINEVRARLEALYEGLADHCEDFKKEFGTVEDAYVDIHKCFDDGGKSFDFYGLYIETFPTRNSKPLKTYRAHLVYALANCVEYTRLSQAEHFDESMACLDQATHFLITAEEQAKNGYGIEERRKKSFVISSLGGSAKAKKLVPIKNEVVRLLKLKCPENGWKSRSVAAQEIADEIGVFQEGIGRPLSPTNLPRLLAKWLSEDLELRSVFEKLKR